MEYFDGNTPDKKYLDLGWSEQAPRLVETNLCFKGPIPTWGSCWESVIEQCRGEENVTYEDSYEISNFSKMEEALIQAFTTRPISTWNVSPSGFRMTWPKESETLILDETRLKDIQMNISTATSLCHFYVDNGEIGITSVIGNLEKLFVCAAGSEENLRILSKYRNRDPESFGNTLIELKNPIIVHLTSKHTIILPPGLIHGTYSITPGILYGVNTTAWDAITAISRYLAFVIGSGNDKEKAECQSLLEMATKKIIKEGTFPLQCAALIELNKLSDTLNNPSILNKTRKL